MERDQSTNDAISFITNTDEAFNNINDSIQTNSSQDVLYQEDSSVILAIREIDSSARPTLPNFIVDESSNSLQCEQTYQSTQFLSSCPAPFEELVLNDFALDDMFDEIVGDSINEE